MRIARAAAVIGDETSRDEKCTSDATRRAMEDGEHESDARRNDVVRVEPEFIYAQFAVLAAGVHEMKIARGGARPRTLARGDLGVTTTTTTTTTTMGDESAPGLDIFSAARAGDMDALGKRVAAGDDVNGKDRAKRTALHLAAWAGQASARRASVFASFPSCVLLSVAMLTCVPPFIPRSSTPSSSSSPRAPRYRRRRRTASPRCTWRAPRASSTWRASS